jgi:hypothetical protein
VSIAAPIPSAPARIGQRRGFDLSAAGAALFVLLTAAAMLVYPGGTIDDHARRGYSFFTNCFSDLGRTRTFDGQGNWPARVLFTSAMIVAAGSIIKFFRAFAVAAASWRHLGRRAAARLGFAGSILGVAAGLCFVGVAFTPWDLYMQQHITFVMWALSLFLLATMLNVLAIVVEPRLPRRAIWVFAAFAIMLLAYIPLLMIGIRGGTSAAASVVVQATGQKIIVYAAILTVMVQSLHMRRQV